MGIKDNITTVSNKIHEDEKILINVFRLEQFYKKYKFLIFFIIAIGVIFFSSKAIIDYIEFNNNIKANHAFIALTENGDENSSKQISILKKSSSNLYQLWQYSKAIDNRDLNVLKELTKSKNSIIKDVSSYHLSIFKNEKTDSKIYKDLSKLNNISILIKNRNFERAKEKLDLIDNKSSFYQISQYFRHSIIKDLINGKSK